MAKPAASSFALLTRNPEDKRAMDVLRDKAVEAKCRCALIELILVLIEDMKNSFKAR
jgi:hypothetical protein